jgi:dienelactone hydrolase
MRYLLAVILILALAAGAQAEVVTKNLEYKQDGTVLEGFLAYDDSLKGPRPGVLVVHEFWGLNDYVKNRTRQLAEMGVVALAVDMYGKGVVTKDPQEARKLAGHLRGTPLMRQRALAGLELLKQNKLVDPKALAAIGFCFGGTTVLELAYAGAGLAGVVSFHGGLVPPKAEDMKNIKAKILVLHGADDPHIKPEEIATFQQALGKAGVDWQMVYYGGAVHSFSNPEAGSDKSKGAAYEPRSAGRSWKHMQVFFKELFIGFI